jgi:hypothetical protein
VTELTPAAVVRTLSQISKEIDELTDELAVLDEATVVKRQEYKVAYARAFLEADGSMDIRRYTAETATADVLLEYELAEQKHRAAVAQLKALRDRLEVGRSLGAIMRLEWTSG